MIYSRIISTGCYIPTNIVTNDDLSKTLNTEDSWIKKRTGISQRYIINKNETIYNMGFLAATDAIKNAKINKSSIDMIIATTTTPALAFPSTACIIQKMLKVKECPAFDVQAACSGFIYATSIADTYIKSGLFKRILIIGTETMSKIIDWSDRSTCVLFGDGAGALILEASKNPGIISIALKANGEYSDYLYLKNTETSCLKMDGKKIFKLAIKNLKDISLQLLKSNKLNITDIDWVIPHQANIRIIRSLAENLNIPIKKFLTTIENYANTSTASIPITLHHGIKDNKIKKNDNLLIKAFGAGITCGSAIIKY